jgi:transcriptional regulator with XRE-family HTH domain
MTTPPADEQLRLIGDVVRQARRARSMSQEAVAAAARVHPNQVGRLERGAADVYTSTMLRIVAGIGVPLSEIARAYDEAELSRPPEQ